MKQSRSRSIFILSVLFFIPVYAMEQFEQEPLLDEGFNQERVELLEVLVDEQDFPPAIWDNSRRFYDGTAKRKAVLKAGKECLKYTGIKTARAMAAGTGLGLIEGLACFGLIALIEHSTNYRSGYGDAMSTFLYFMETWSTIGASVAFLIGLPIIAIYEARAKILPALAERNPFKSYHPKICGCSITVNPNQSISPNLIKYADEKKQYYEPKENLQYFLEIKKPLLWNIRRKIFPADRLLDDVFQRITRRVEDASPLRDEYRRTAFLLKKLLIEKLGRDPVQYLHQFFPNKNILHHVLAHHDPAFWSTYYTYLSEKEQLVIATGLGLPGLRLDAYINATTLAENGWVAFAPSEKYPIRCHTKFFERFALPHEAQRVYTREQQACMPTVYLPYHPDLARYYKFEEDPHYQQQYEHSSNEKIRRLLALRHEILVQQIENEHNNNP